MIRTALVRTLALVAAFLGGCRPFIVDEHADALSRTLAGMAAEAGLGLAAPSLVRTGTVDAANLSAWAERVIERSVRLTGPAGATPPVPVFASAGDPAQAAGELVQRGLIRPGDQVYAVRWRLPGGGTAETLAVVSPAAELRYEPIVHFAARLEQLPDEVARGSVRARYRVAVSKPRAGGGRDDCGGAQWRLDLETEGCRVTNPPPRLSRVSCATSCFGYTIACTEGERDLCRDNLECPECGELVHGERCVRAAMQMVVAFGDARLGASSRAGQPAISDVPVGDFIQVVAGDKRNTSARRLLRTVCAASLQLPAPDGEVAFQIDQQFIQSDRQRGAVVSIDHDPGDCTCGKVVFAQMIRAEGGTWRVDVDPAVTGVATPFYNHDPARGRRVPSSDLGEPGGCGAGGGATLRDVPARSQLTDWETCAVCCDDGRLLGCRRWRYDPALDRGTSIGGERVRGLYVDLGAVASFSPEAGRAQLEALRQYARANPGAAADPCVANLMRTLSR